MKEKFEHKLVNKIKDVFDSHQSDINPQDWELMKGNLPDKKSRFVPLFWTITKVASVLLFIAFGSYFLWNGLNNEDSRIIDNESIVNTIPVPEEETNNIQSQTIDSSNFILQEYLAKESDINQSTYDEDLEINERTHHPSGQIAELSNTVTDQPSDINIADGNFKDTLLIQIPESTDNITDTVPLKNDSVFETNNETKQSTIAQLEILPEFIENEPRQRQKARIGVEFATFANYSPENIAPSMNYGGGLAAHIPIKKRFSFNPGLIVSVYNMEFSEQMDVSKQTSLTFTNIDNLQESYPDIKPSELNLTGLDIPINFQYQFIKRRTSNYFIELGFSSLIYLSEKYVYTFNTLSNTPDPHGGFEVEETTMEEIPASSNKTFDFAKLINFSVGWDYHLSNRVDMTLNPFLKYPVTTLTSGDIKFGSGGLKLKLMLIPKK